ncbi:MAG: AAA family ATPase [Proteobacteria bacterium]|nr:AAA family ATPase [Pseudomonadota bacterium]
MKDDILRALRETCSATDYMVLVAIHPDTKAIEACPYGADADTMRHAAQWAEQHKEWNVYYSVNPTRTSMRKKPTKTDVAAMAYVHCDIDDPSPEKLRQIQSYEPPPSRIVFSGGGWQAFWRLRAPPKVNGQIEDLEAVNRRVLEDLYPEDLSTCNIDRIMRLAGTVNHPTETKRKKGRTSAVEAYVEEDHPDRLYDLSDFGRAAAPTTTAAVATTAPSSAEPLDLYQLNLPYSLHYAVAHGKRERDGSDDRSDEMYWAANELSRSRVPRSVAKQIFQQFPIGAHARDQGDPERSIERALAKAYAQVPAFFQIPEEWHTEEPPPLRWTWEGLCPEETLMLLAGDGGIGKSSFALKVGLAVATGGSVLGRAVAQGVVAYVGMEETLKSLRLRYNHSLKRQREWLMNEGASPERIARHERDMRANFRPLPGAGLQLHLISMERNEAKLSEQLDGLVDNIKALGRTALVVLDPMARLNGGEENASNVGTAMIAAGERIVNECGCSVLLIHHVSKDAAKQESVTMHASRGSSALPAGARSVLIMTHVAKEEAKKFEDVTEEQAARGDLILVTHAKCNEAPKAEPFMILRDATDFRLFDPTKRKEAKLAASILGMLYRWWISEERKRAPMVVSKLESAAILKDIFHPYSIGRDQLRSAWDLGVHDGTLVKHAKAARTDKFTYVFKDGYEPPEEPGLGFRSPGASL